MNVQMTLFVVIHTNDKKADYDQLPSNDINSALHTQVLIMSRCAYNHISQY